MDDIYIFSLIRNSATFMEYSKTRSILSNDIKGGGIQDVVVYQRLCSLCNYAFHV